VPKGPCTGVLGPKACVLVALGRHWSSGTWARALVALGRIDQHRSPPLLEHKYHKWHKTSRLPATWNKTLGHKCACFRYEPALSCPKDHALEIWELGHASWSPWIGLVSASPLLLLNIISKKWHKTTHILATCTKLWDISVPVFDMNRP